MNVARIRGFLLQVPKPAVIRLSSDGEPQELKPGKSYQRTAESIAALSPELIECLDSDGKLLRAMRTDNAEAQRSQAAEVPTGLAGDPQALMLVHFSNQIHRAYEHATEIAFAKMVEVFDIMSARSEGIEQRLERQEALNRKLLQEQVDDAFQRADEVAQKAAEGENGGFVEQMATAFISGQMNQKMAPKPQATNGSSKGSA